MEQALRRDQPLREETRRRRNNDHQGRDVRLARGAAEATDQAALAARQVLEVQPEGRRRALAVAEVPGGLSGDSGAAHRGARRPQLGLAASRFRRRSREKAARRGLAGAETTLLTPFARF